MNSVEQARNVIIAQTDLSVWEYANTDLPSER